jgi:hypothetical protein
VVCQHEDDSTAATALTPLAPLSTRGEGGPVEAPTTQGGALRLAPLAQDLPHSAPPQGRPGLSSFALSGLTSGVLRTEGIRWSAVPQGHLQLDRALAFAPRRPWRPPHPLKEMRGNIHGRVLLRPHFPGYAGLRLPLTRGRTCLQPSCVHAWRAPDATWTARTISYLTSQISYQIAMIGAPCPSQ